MLRTSIHLHLKKDKKIPFIPMYFRLVNQNWATKKINQKCKEDIVHIGNNWDGFLWPSSVVLKDQDEIDGRGAKKK